SKWFKHWKDYFSCCRQNRYSGSEIKFSIGIRISACIQLIKSKSLKKPYYIITCRKINYRFLSFNFIFDIKFKTFLFYIPDAKGINIFYLKFPCFFLIGLKVFEIN